MDEIQGMLAKSADALSLGNFKDAYFCYLDIIDATAVELRKVKFIANVAITSTTTASLISITRTSVAYAQDILSKHNAAIAAINEPSAMPRKSSLSRHSDRITSGQTKTVTMLTEQLQATTADLSSAESQQSPSPVSSRSPAFPSRSATSPVASPPPSRPILPSIPPKPTRKPPQPLPSPTFASKSPVLAHSENGTMPSTGARSTMHSLAMPNNNNGTSSARSPEHHTRPMSAPAYNMALGDSQDPPSPPQSKPPLPPKPARLYRKLHDIKAEMHSMDEDDSDEDDDDDDLEGNAFITVIPDGSVDPTNLVEAERISGDNEDQLDQKTYGPSDHIPLIPVTPLRTTHRTLVEKEKTCSAKLAETKQRLQERTVLSSSKSNRDQVDDEDDIQTVQDNVNKYTSMISNTMATITKVRELLYRSASITSILEFPAYLVAYQLTLIESAIFLEIPPSALLTHSPKTPHRSITASTDFFNYLTRMIEYSVLFPPEASGRAQCMHYWVKVAVKLHELENFQTLKAVLSALGTPPVKRLKRTWGFVPRKSMHKLETLSELMSEGRNYGKYREMMSSLNAGTLLLSPATVSPVHATSTSAPVAKLDMLSLNGVSSSLSNLGFRAKEAARRPMVPFLGTFIMDITYLLAAVKKSNSTAPPISAQIPATSSLREKPAPSSAPSISTQFAPEDDVRIQDLLMTLSAYQSGPKYSPHPPRSYIKAATKNHHHFRAPSLSSALHRTAKYRTPSVDRQIGANITHQSYDDEEDDVSGNGIRPTQQLILHYLLTRPWVPERMVDELSTIREPPKNKNLSAGPTLRTSAGGSATHSWPGLSAGATAGATQGGSTYSTTSTIQRGSTGSNSGDGHNGSGGSSRPTSVDE
ncbi:DELLA protein rgl2 [Mortierella alpina]|nr:DELLA protein rgl2 [Mortierella alpina]